MALDITPIYGSPPLPHEARQLRAGQVAHTSAPAVSQAYLETAARDLERVSAAFNRRLSFHLNEKLGQVVVKVIDNDTDKVIREIPPSELQHVYERIREVMGLLFDEKA
jgi:flagellar protein FlaG